MSTVLAISDLHCPWQHPAAFDFLADLKRRHRPSLVVCLGDEIDAHAFSRFVKGTDAPTAKQEMEMARIALRDLYRIFPRVKVVESNHTFRPFKRLEENGIPRDFVRPLRDLLNAPRGWSWHPRLVNDNVLYIHGDGFAGKDAHATASERHRINVVMGHVHAYAGISYRESPFSRIWGMNAGCLIDPDAYVFDYGKHLANRPVLGTGLVIDGVPQFVPMKT